MCHTYSYHCISRTKISYILYNPSIHPSHEHVNFPPYPDPDEVFVVCFLLARHLTNSCFSAYFQCANRRWFSNKLFRDITIVNGLHTSDVNIAKLFFLRNRRFLKFQLRNRRYTSTHIFYSPWVSMTGISTPRTGGVSVRFGRRQALPHHSPLALARPLTHARMFPFCFFFCVIFRSSLPCILCPSRFTLLGFKKAPVSLDSTLYSVPACCWFCFVVFLWVSNIRGHS